MLEALRTELDTAVVTFASGCAVTGDDRGAIAPAAASAAAADVAVVVVGDQAGLFGRGTCGEGCDTDDLELPGVQRELVEAVIATGPPSCSSFSRDARTPSAGRLTPALPSSKHSSPAKRAPQRCGVVSGRVNPSGRLPVSLPGSAAVQPYSYLHPPLGDRSNVSNLDPSPARPFGFGLSYTFFAYDDLLVACPQVTTDGAIGVSVQVTNTGAVQGDDVVQLYAQDVVASITRPVAQLLCFQRVCLARGEAARVHQALPTGRLAFSGRDMVRVVEPGAIELCVGRSCTERAVESVVERVRPCHIISGDDPAGST